jgi:mRNA interferase MazF
MKRGDVYWADLAPSSGSEQQGRRPVVVISHDAFNQTQSWRSIIVVPLSTSIAQAGRGPSAVLLSQGAAGLDKDSVALCHQVTTLDRSKLSQRIGELNAMELTQIEDGLKAAMDMQ